MSEVTPIEANMTHEVCELMCVKCGYRYIGAFPQKTLLKELECPSCDWVGFIIKTGQTILEKEECSDENTKKRRVGNPRGRKNTRKSRRN